MKIIEIVGDSMYPTFKPGQLLITKKIKPTELIRGTIVVYPFFNKPLIKRVIGMPNEVVQLQSNLIIINGEVLKEPYLKINRLFIEDFNWKTTDGEIILLGDNSLNSLDSRKFGPVKLKELTNRPVFRIWPPKYIGLN